MIKKIKSFALVFLAAVAFLAGCEKKEYSFGDFKTPSDLTLTAVVAGVDASNPNGNGTGAVAITATAKNAISYKVDFGDGKSQIVPSGIINYKYTNPGTDEYVITVNAIGTGGVVSTISKKVTVFVAFEIPATILQNMTGGTSKIWVSDKEAPGHFGVGPNDQFSPIWYEAGPNSRDACSYDDEITFTKDANNNILMTIDNKGQSFSIGASTAFYGFGGGDACLGVTAAGTKKLAFMDATSASTPSNSTRIQFDVPGNGLIIFGTGATTYEILSLTATTMHLRNIGIDGNAWYQKLKVKS
ncbi:PKD domain-containing protein [Lacibacter sediminis]|uniref:PKD domain-containing protein n=1 Tax=Lacibacter sediminis TaxID=2760713 RepID=A0A7G5XJE7_9BACT|nr:PKD domain-containing protein [Lacibacter sediminis]QNA45600.1 PKD domain-containing protein [Lacibacter sediminis]